MKHNHCIILGDGPASDFFTAKISLEQMDIKVLKLGRYAKNQIEHKLIGHYHRLDPTSVRSILPVLTKNGISSLCFVGAFDEPERVDEFPRIGTLIDRGHDACFLSTELIEASIAYFQQKQISIVSPNHYAPELETQRGMVFGNMGTYDPKVDIAASNLIVDTLEASKRSDAFQAFLLDSGNIIDIHNINLNTNDMIQRLAKRRNEFKFPVLLKRAVRPWRSVLTPSIGLETVQKCLEANIPGILIEGGTVCVYQKEEILKLISKKDFFLYTF